MFCTSCGREHFNKCICMNENKISRFETFLLFFFVMTTPGIFNVILIRSGVLVLNSFNVMLSSSISLSFIVTVLLITYYIFNKNYITLFFGCHQRVSRTIRINKKYFVLCARCTGILGGIYLSIGLSLLPVAFYWYFILGLPLIIDGFWQKKTTYKSNNLKRFITGIFFAPTFIIIFGLFHYLLLEVAIYFSPLF